MSTVKKAKASKVYGEGGRRREDGKGMPTSNVLEGESKLEFAQDLKKTRWSQRLDF